MGLSSKIILALLVVISVMASGGYWYYKDTQNRMQVLNQNNAVLEVAVQTNEETITQLTMDYERSQLERQRLDGAYADIRRQNAMLMERLSEHDLGALAAGRPELVERLVNRGTVNALRCFELLSGAELTEEERNAESGREFNNECPWLWPNSISASGM